MNPQFKKYVIPADEDHKFELRLPSAKASLFVQYKDSIYRHQARIYPDKPVYVSGVQSSSAHPGTDSNKKTTTTTTVQEAPAPQHVWINYTFKATDKLPEIATLFDVSLYYLMRWNNLRNYYVNPGRKLVVYVPAAKASYYKGVNIMTTAQKRKLLGLPAESIAVKAPVQSPKQTAQEKQINTQFYVVQKGDTIWSIAQRFPGVSVDDIKRANGLTEKHSIHVGQKIKIQKKA